MASVAGLAPARTSLKGWMRELLCIHGRNWPPRSVSRQRLLVFSEALICLSYSGKWSSWQVTLRVFRLSAGCSAFELQDVAEGVGNAPTSAMPILFSGQVQPAYICLPSKNGCQSWTRTNTARLNRPACYFDTTWQWLFIVRGIRRLNSVTGAAGRILTCIVPFRRRMPDIFDHGSNLKLVSAAGVAPAIPRSQAECVAATLRADRSERF